MSVSAASIFGGPSGLKMAQNHRASRGTESSGMPVAPGVDHGTQHGKQSATRGPQQLAVDDQPPSSTSSSLGR